MVSGCEQRFSGSQLTAARAFRITWRISAGGINLGPLIIRSTCGNAEMGRLRGGSPVYAHELSYSVPRY
jgi:hypothetical protein